MATITIRQATLEDKEAILKIHDNVYGGLDYLPAVIDEFFENQNSTSYVAVLNDELVGFTNMFLVDDGNTVVSRASRVSPSAEGQGVYKTLHTYALNETTAKTLAFTSTVDNKSVHTPSFQRNYTLLQSKLIQSFSSPAFDEECPTEETERMIVDLHIPSNEEMNTFFDSSILKSYLFPSNRVFVNWCPFQLISSNISLMKRYFRTQNLIYSDVKVDSINQAHGLLSISTTIRVKNPPFASHVFIYGTDAKTLKSHVCAHVNNAKIISKGARIKFLVIYQQDIDKDTLIKCFTELGLSIDSWKSTFYLFEKEIQ
ncbi:Hairy/enhancer-of-split with YRPW motif protein 1 [Mactra antiquata]